MILVSAAVGFKLLLPGAFVMATAPRESDLATRSHLVKILESFSGTSSHSAMFETFLEEISADFILESALFPETLFWVKN